MTTISSEEKKRINFAAKFLRTALRAVLINSKISPSKMGLKEAKL